MSSDIRTVEDRLMTALADAESMDVIFDDLIFDVNKAEQKAHAGTVIAKHLIRELKEAAEMYVQEKCGR